MVVVVEEEVCLAGLSLPKSSCPSGGTALRVCMCVCCDLAAVKVEDLCMCGTVIYTPVLYSQRQNAAVASPASSDPSAGVVEVHISAERWPALC